MESANYTYRGIIHNHSACSKEGCYPLNVLYERWAGTLDFAAMTEHAERTTAEDYARYVQECDALSSRDFRFIAGLEVATGSGDMLLLGCRKYICTRDPFQVLGEAQGCVILLAHPEEGKIIPAVLEQAHGVEAWNGGHMGGYMPPIDRLAAWRKQLPTGKILTGGNDIHTVDPKRKILTVVHLESRPITGGDILEALRQGHFTTSNGIFSLAPGGQVFYHGHDVSSQPLFALLARGYRLGWHSINACLEMGESALAGLGLDKEKRTRLNRLIRQHL